MNLLSIRATQITSNIIWYGKWRHSKALSGVDSSSCPVGTMGKAAATTYLPPRVRGTFSSPFQIFLYFHKEIT